MGAKDIVGEADGSCDTVGAALIVGGTEGVIEGVEEGRFVGVALGTWEGAAVVGLNVGSSVGEGDGAGVGLEVGFNVKVPQGMLHVQGQAVINSKISCWV